ncbi:MAG: Fe2+-dependent dioxygenase [Rhodanobacteraceae bacterium]|nr:Fe2+-dependent dioxygenase [Rhodanobacteraceae bacterium]MBL0042521.1 Fe2+-dependent dioxygenase [Xanthomonadales bacterium]MBP6077233.1 Fe2+-dependent dioxygenase [Xanthomonadales bacterium]MBP7622755.1 Fe2+-dependent dioxygenase [Xanthomonadales bacterium]
MLLTFDEVIDAPTVQRFRATLANADWIDGVVNAGTLSRAVKFNQQLDDHAPQAIELGNVILRRLGTHPGFLSAALPERIHPPKFNRYAGGGRFGVHVDGAIMRIADANLTMRSDLSATLFLTDPADYDGGELQIETPFGAQAVKLPAGSMVLYPSSSLHQVTPVTRGERVCAFFWIQSMVRDEGERTLLHDLDRSIQSLSARADSADRDIVALTGIYYNLLRRWAVV